jgi:hypothetical protein
LDYDDDMDPGPPDQHDDTDFGANLVKVAVRLASQELRLGHSRAQAGSDPLARFIQELEDLSSMNGPNKSAVKLCA